jgi:hypothetical protein
VEGAVRIANMLIPASAPLDLHFVADCMKGYSHGVEKDGYCELALPKHQRIEHTAQAMIDVSSFSKPIGAI